MAPPLYFELTGISCSDDCPVRGKLTTDPTVLIAADSLRPPVEVPRRTDPRREPLLKRRCRGLDKREP